MHRKGQLIAALVTIVVGIVTIIAIISYLNSRPTVALRTLLTLHGACDTLSPDWSLIAASGQIYDATTGQVRLTLKPSDMQVSFSPDSAYVAAAGDGVYDLRSGQFLFPSVPSGANYPYYSPQFSPDNKYVEMPYDGVYELPGGKKIGPANGFMGAEFSPDSRYAAIVPDGVYDLATGQQVFAIHGPVNGEVGQFSPDGKYLAVVRDGLYQVDTGKLIARTGNITFTPDSSLAATTNGVFDLTTGKRILPETMANDSDLARSTLSSDGKRVLVEQIETPESQQDVMVLTVYDIPSRKSLFQIKKQNGKRLIFPYSFSPDGKSLAIWQDGVYDVDSGKKRFSITGIDGNENLLLLAPQTFDFSQDSSVLFVPNIGAYDLRTGQVRFTFGAVVATSSDGRLIGDRTGNTKGGVYEVATGARLADGWAHFQPNGNKVAINPLNPGGSCKIYEVIPSSTKPS